MPRLHHGLRARVRLLGVGLTIRSELEHAKAIRVGAEVERVGFAQDDLAILCRDGFAVVSQRFTASRNKDGTMRVIPALAANAGEVPRRAPSTAKPSQALSD